MSEEVTYSPDEVSYDATPPAEGPGPTDPQVYIKDSKGLKTGKYPRAVIQNIVSAAKATGVDPYQALSLALQESGFGTVQVRGRRGKFAAPLGQIHDFSDAQQQELDKLASSTGLDPEALKLTIALRDKINYGKALGYTSEPAILQAYNGYGTITPESFGGETTAYGVDISKGVSLKKNPLYGQRLVQLKNDLMANEYIQSLLK